MSRLSSVYAVVYLFFNEGYLSAQADRAVYGMLYRIDPSPLNAMNRAGAGFGPLRSGKGAPQAPPWFPSARLVFGAQEIVFNSMYGSGREEKNWGKNMAQGMLKTGLKTGLIGTMLGIGLGFADSRDLLPVSAMAPPEAVAACHKRSLESAVDLYGIRTLGREEAGITGVGLTGRMEPDARAFQQSIYQLRTLGRAEARHIGQSMEGAGEGLDILAGVGAVRDIYSQRSLGREEARSTGIDYCEVASLETMGYSLK